MVGNMGKKNSKRSYRLLGFLVVAVTFLIGFMFGRDGNHKQFVTGQLDACTRIMTTINKASAGFIILTCSEENDKVLISSTVDSNKYDLDGLKVR